MNTSQKIMTQIVGGRIPPVDGAEKVTGITTYIDDIELPDLLTGMILRSPYPHAKILNVDTSRAERLSGVYSVLSWKNTPRTHFGICKKDEASFCQSKVRYIGDEVAAVAAMDSDTARAALDLIEIEYEPIPALENALSAMEKGAPLVHENTPGNIAHEIQLTRGDIHNAFNSADKTFEDDYHTQLAHQAYIEPTGCVAQWHQGGQITVWSCLQSVFVARSFMLSPVMGIRTENIRVIQTKPGGAFGGKLDVKATLLASLLARSSKRPVKLLFSLEEDLTNMRPRMPIHIHLQSAFSSDGKLLGRRQKVYADNGAYSSFSPKIAGSVAMRTDNLYRTPAIEVVAKLIYSNVCPTGQMRGFGNPQATFAWETHLDNVAENLGIDPVDLRLRNYIKQGDVTIHGWKIASCGIDETTRYAQKAIKWKQKRKQGGNGRGVGLASTIHSSGNKAFAFEQGETEEPSTAIIRINENGKVEIYSGESDLGQGSSNVMAFIAAEILGLDVKDFNVPPTDTACMPFGFGALASRITLIGGNAVKIAATETRKILLKAAGKILEVSSEQLSIQGQVIFVKGYPEHRVNVKEVVRKQGGTIEGKGTWLAGGEVPNEKMYGNPSTTYSFATHAAEVEVDMETGTVKVLNLVAGHDLGRVINRFGAEGQVDGGLIQGMGYCLTEDLKPSEGKILGNNFHEYLIPTSMDIPNIEMEFFETIDPYGPYGAKGLAETAINPTAAAISNAVSHAIGAKIKHLPLAPELILKAIRGESLQPTPQRRVSSANPSEEIKTWHPEKE